MSRRWWCLFIASCLIGAHPAPAPIVEEPQATPQPATSTTPRPKRTAQPKATNENSETSRQPARSTPAPKKQTSRNLVQGTWIGVFAKDNRTIIVGGGSVS